MTKREISERLFMILCESNLAYRLANGLEETAKVLDKTIENIKSLISDLAASEEEPKND